MNPILLSAHALDESTRRAIVAIRRIDPSAARRAEGKYVALLIATRSARAIARRIDSAPSVVDARILTVAARDALDVASDIASDILALANNVFAGA